MVAPGSKKGQDRRPQDHSSEHALRNKSWPVTESLPTPISLSLSRSLTVDAVQVHGVSLAVTRMETAQILPVTTVLLLCCHFLENLGVLPCATPI
jgi:hypothetical protein